jgi:hypothetical protein
MKYLHTMVRVTDLPTGRFTLAFLAAPGQPEAQIELTHNWDSEAYTGGEPWASMPNSGSW